MLQAQLLERHEIDDVLWENFVMDHANDIVYFHAWYLDMVCNHWKAVVVKQHGQWMAILPLQIRHKLGFNYSLQPMFCKYLGVLFHSDIANHMQHSIQKKIVALVIDALPKPMLYLNASFHPQFLNFLPFYWQRFNIIPRFTYRLSLTAPEKYSTSITNHLKKANSNNLRCLPQHSPDALIKLAKDRQLLMPSGIAIFEKLWNYLDKEQQSLLLTVEDNLNRVHCAAAFLQENSKVFMIFSVVNDTLKQQGANALLLTQAMRYFKERGVEWFYFEGSMLKNVEAYINGFRAEPVLYFGITRSIIPFSENILIPSYQKIQKLGERFVS